MYDMSRYCLLPANYLKADATPVGAKTTPLPEVVTRLRMHTGSSELHGTDNNLPLWPVL